MLEGIPDHRDPALSAHERASNKTMMICCSGCLGERLLLELKAASMPVDGPQSNEHGRGSHRRF
jgi:hypothetical protein